MKIGKNLKELRESREKSISDLAKALNIDDKTIDKWEHDLSVPDMNQLIEISRNLNIDIDELLKDRIDDDPIENRNEKKSIFKAGITNFFEPELNEEEKLIFIAGKTNFFEPVLNDNEWTNNIYRRQKMLVKISSIILLIYFIILFVLTMIFLGFSIASIINLNFDNSASFLAFVIGIILTYYLFKIRNKLLEISNYDDFRFIQFTNVVLKIGFILSIFFLLIPGLFLIVAYFSTDTDKYFKSKKFDEIYSKLVVSIFMCKL